MSYSRQILKFYAVELVEKLKCWISVGLLKKFCTNIQVNYWQSGGWSVQTEQADQRTEESCACNGARKRTERPVIFFPPSDRLYEVVFISRFNWVIKVSTIYLIIIINYFVGWFVKIINTTTQEIGSEAGLTRRVTVTLQHVTKRN